MVYDFGMRLKELREKRGLTQAEAGKRMGLSRTGLANYERNTSQPSVDVLKTIASFYRTSTDYLLGLDNQDVIVLKNITEDESRTVHTVVDALLDQFQQKNK